MNNFPNSRPLTQRAPPPVHWVVKFDNNRPAIPFGVFHSAYSLAKRATSENHPAQAVEVYEHAGVFFDSAGSVVKVRGAA